MHISPLVSVVIPSYQHGHLIGRAIQTVLDQSFSNWEGEGMDEKGYDTETGNLLVAVDKRYFRPTEVETLLGDPSKAKEKLGWEPKITLEEMVHVMMENDINIAKRDSLVKEHGFKAPDFNE